MTDDAPTWFLRLEAQRKHAGLSMERLAAKLGISRPTLYAWRSGSQPGTDAVGRLAEFLGEAREALAAEMGLVVVPSAAQRLDMMAARSFNVALVREHIDGLARVLQLVEADGTDSAARPTGHAAVDVVASLLRLALVKRSINAMVAVRPEYRGIEHRRLFQWQVCVVPVAGTTSVRGAINDTLSSQLLDVYFERSRELWPSEFQGTDDAIVLLVPDLQATRMIGSGSVLPAVDYQSDTLVLSLGWGGAQDVGALIAERLGHSFVHCEGLARSNLGLGPWTGSAHQLSEEIRIVLDHACDDAPRTRRPIVWAQSDPNSLYESNELPLKGRRFRGRVVVLMLDDAGLAYAADRYKAIGVSETASWRGPANRQAQAQMIAGAQALLADPDLLVVVEVSAPAGLERVDGNYRDSVDSWFDAYVSAAADVLRELTARR